MLKFDDIFGVLDLLLLIGEAAQPRCGSVRPLLQQGKLGAWHAQLVSDDINGQGHTEPVEQIHFSVVNPFVNQLIGYSLNISAHAFDSLIGKHFVHQIAVHPMPRRILGQQRLDHLIPLLIDSGDILIGRTGIEQRAEGAREPGGIANNFPNVVVSGHNKHVGPGHLPYRGFIL